MNFETPTDVPLCGSWTPPGRLKKMGRPATEALADFVHACSPDPGVRTTATTALLLSFWQLRGRALTGATPSVISIDATGAGYDPVDEFAKDLVFDGAQNRPQVQTDGPLVGATPELVPVVMANAFRGRRAMGQVPADDPDKLHKAEGLEQRFHAARKTGHGYGLCRPYAEAWHPDYGLLTDAGDELILRLNGDPDHAAFRADVLGDPSKLVFPQGVGGDLSMVPKSISLSGSLPPDLWDKALASALVAYGLPVFVLPHLAEGQFEVPNSPAIECLAATWRHARLPAVAASATLPMYDPVRAYQTSLRNRLAKLPAAYEFVVGQAVHQLAGVCNALVLFAGEGGADGGEMAALFKDLYGHALRGMAIGVASLSWHGHGLYLGPGCEPLRGKASKLLEYLRGKGATPCGTILKNLHLKKAERDQLLDRLAYENLLKVEGSEVAATTFGEFVAGLHARDEFPPLENHWAEARGEGRAANQAGR